MEKVGDGGVDNVSWGRIFDEPAITPSSIRGSPDGTMSRRGSIVWVVYSFFSFFVSPFSSATVSPSVTCSTSVF